MAEYKVSYKVLSEQGEELKAVSKLIDSYADRASNILGKLGDDAMLSEVRGNLAKLREQLGESRVVLNTSGELLIRSVESYSGTEIRQVKKVDGMKAHNRDFYKNPVVVASAGGAVAGAAVVGTVSAPAAIPDSTVSSAAVSPVAPAPVAPEAQAIPAAQPVAVARPAEAAAPAAKVSSPAASSTGGTAIAAGVGALGGAAAAAGAILGGANLKKKRGGTASEAADADGISVDAEPEDDALEAQLQAALERVRQLSEEDEN